MTTDAAPPARAVPESSRRLLRAGWIMARAFTPHSAFAVLALPWTLLAITPGALRGGLFLDSARTGMVMLYRSRMVLDVLLVVPLLLLGMALFGLGLPVLLQLLLPAEAVFPVLMVAGLLLLSGIVFLLPRDGGSATPWGPETPPGPRWEIAGLAQLPGTRYTAIQLARRVVATVPPPGAVIVASAGSPTLFRQYQRLGFVGGQKRRVYKVIPHTPTTPPH